MPSEEAQSDHEFVKTIGAISGFLLLETVIILAVLHLPGIPYNVRELFLSGVLPLRVFIFSFLTIWLGMAPSLVGRFLVVHKNPKLIWLMPVWVILVGLGIWILLQFSVTEESQGDILGSIILNWPGSLEKCMRLCSLQAPLTIFQIVFFMTFWTRRENDSKTTLKIFSQTFFSGLPWIVLSAMVVFHWPSTDNIVELIRFQPFTWLGPVALLILAAMIAANAAKLVDVLESSPGSFFKWIFFTILLIIPGWALLYTGLHPAVEKYGHVFPAIRFLLGPDRVQVISWAELFLRWSIVQVGIVCCLAWGGWIAGRLWNQGNPFRAKLKRQMRQHNSLD